MSPEVIGLVGLVVLVALLFAGMWIGAAMALVGFLGYAYIMGIQPAFGVVAQIPFKTVAYYPLTVVPMFVLMGCLLFYSGVGADLYESAYKWIGQLRGGLAMATVVSCAFFAAITGISAPAIVTMAKSALPQMRKYNYNDRLALGSIVCSGTLAFLIPPSMSFILYGILTEQSIGALFMAGVLPGILLSALFIITIVVITIFNPQAAPAGPKTSLREKIGSLKDTWPVVALFILILGGIYGGIFTPTEAGAIGAFGAVVFTAVKRRLTIKKLMDSLLETAQTSAMIFLLITGAYILMKFLAVSKLPLLLSKVVSQLPVPPGVILAAIIALYILLGMFLDIMSATILTIPVIYPLILILGYDPIWFGVLITLLIQMGLVTPPVGLDAFILAGAAKVPLADVFRGVIPFLVAVLVCIVIIIFFPQIVLFIPKTMP
ncbi:MAG: TRAP transporter large permease subunit [Bacillota bacterium]